MEYASGTFTAPFWAQSSPFNKGRDPLGIQNSSIVVFARLLPGMTNLTHRIRYYGFYLWVLKEYRRQPHFKDNYKEQYQFIRRAELLLACIMRVNEPAQQGVSGSNFTARELPADAGVLDLAAGAAFHASNARAYWKYNSGAFGQYYAGSLVALSLVETLDETRFFHRTGKGKELADRFGANLAPAQRELFLSIVQAGTLAVPDARLLKDFSLSRDVTHTAEWQFYLDVLMEADDPALIQPGSSGEHPGLRRQTLKLFLEYVQREPEDPEGLPRLLYLNQGYGPAGQYSKAGYGWYYYQLNEYLHYALETVFWYLLFNLRERDEPLFVESFVEETVGVMEDLLEEEGFVNLPAIPLEEAILLLDDQVRATGLIEPIRRAVKAGEPGNGLRAALLLLLSCYRENREALPALREYRQRHGLTQLGNAVDLAEMLITRNLSRPVPAFFQSLISWVINDHLQTAYRKMGTTEDNVLKLLIEDGHITGLEVVEPGFTSPRLRTLLGFARDLRLLDEQHALTEPGDMVLQLLEP